MFTLALTLVAAEQKRLESRWRAAEQEHVRELIIGASRHRSRTVLEWIPASNSSWQPHTERGGCDRCLGTVTIDSNQVTRNPAYYLPHGGRCPKGRRTEDGVIPEWYALRETPSRDYSQRTGWNVRDSDMTVIFTIGLELTGGSKLTAECAARHGKPWLHLAKAAGGNPAGKLSEFFATHAVRLLNVPGLRASKEPGVAAFVQRALEETWTQPAAQAAPPAATIETERYLLRPLNLSDAPAVARLAGQQEIADTTISIPLPYSEDQARAWMSTQTGQNGEREVVFATMDMRTGGLIGRIGLRDTDTEHSQAELGFWIAVHVWRKGYGTEAARAVVGFAFDRLRLNRVYTHHMVRNPASGRVLEKIGMKREGLLRQRVRK